MSEAMSSEDTATDGPESDPQPVDLAWLGSLGSIKARELRYGQRLFNDLYRVAPEIADRIRSGEDDPFYDDGRVLAFLRALVAQARADGAAEERERRRTLAEVQGTVVWHRVKPGSDAGFCKCCPDRHTYGRSIQQDGGNEDGMGSWIDRAVWRAPEGARVSLSLALLEVPS